MESRKVVDGFIIKLERGEEVIAVITSFVAEHHIEAGFLSGIGAVRNLEIGYFNTSSKSYQKKTIEKTVEVVSLSGNISLLGGNPFVHAHIAIADENHHLWGGHLFRAEVAVTLEMYLKTINTKLVRELDPEIGFNFWHL